MMTDELRAQIIAARKEGKTHDEIAEQFGLSRSYVTNICIAGGLKTRGYEKRKISRADRENKLKEISYLLRCEKTEPMLVQLGRIIAEMAEADESGTFYSDGNVGLCITSTEIEIVDTETGTVATIQVNLKK